MRRFTIDLSTNGGGQIINLTPLFEAHRDELAGDGLVHLFVAGSTAGLTTLEYEPGLVKHDLPTLFERLAPVRGHYYHEATWNDDNGHSHVLSALFRPDLTVPFAAGRLLTGQWQNVVLIDFDTRPRRRQLVCTVMQ